MFAEALVYGLEAYAALGLLFAVAFVTVAVERVDHTANGATFGFRLVILPGSIALWPVLAALWIRGPRPEGT
jgi:hypothetical protein